MTARAFWTWDVIPAPMADTAEQAHHDLEDTLSWLGELRDVEIAYHLAVIGGGWNAQMDLKRRTRAAGLARHRAWFEQQIGVQRPAAACQGRVEDWPVDDRGDVLMPSLFRLTERHILGVDL